MSKKRISLLAVVLAVILVLCACAQNTAPHDDTQPSQVPTVQTDPTVPTLASPSEPTQPIKPTEPVPPILPESKPIMSVPQALYGASSDGYSIWTVPISLTAVKKVCVDSEGYVAFEMDGSEIDIAGVHHGGVLLKGENGRYFLRAVPSGDLVFNSVNEENIRIILPQYHGKQMFRDGYVIAFRFSQSGYEMGILDPQGQWIVPISPDCGILPHMNTDLSAAMLEKEISYLGEGIIGILCKDGIYRYYNMNTDAVITPQFPNNLSKQTIYDALNYNVLFIDGVSDPVFLNNNYYLFYANGRVDAFNVLWPKGLPRAKKCGDPYFDRHTKIAYFLYDYGSGILVCDSNGNIIKKQEGYKIINDQSTTADNAIVSGFASDGFARIIIEKDPGELSYAVVGANGEFLFAPVELSSNANTVYDPEGNHIRAHEAMNACEYLIINLEGTICYQSDEVKDFSVRNGVFHFKEDNEDIYIIVQAPALY